MQTKQSRYPSADSLVSKKSFSFIASWCKYVFDSIIPFGLVVKIKHMMYHLHWYTKKLAYFMAQKMDIFQN